MDLYIIKVSIIYFTDNGSGTEEYSPGPVLSGAEAVLSESETIPQSAEPVDGDLSEEISASDAAATLKAEKRRKRARRALLAAIIFIAVILVLAIIVTVLIGFSIFSPNTGVVEINSYALKPEIFFYCITGILLLFIIEIILIFLFLRKKVSCKV